MAFSLPVSKITATWLGVNSGDNLQIKINGQFLTLTTAMISGASLSADKLTALGTGASFTMMINAADVPGGVINSITLVAPGNVGAGGFYSTNFTVTESPYTAAQIVTQLFSGVYSDADPDAMKGVVITSAGQGTDSSTLGSYVYSSDNGVTWKTLASGLSDSNAVFLKNTDQVRFVRAAANTSTLNKSDLMARLVDMSGVGTSSSLVSGTVVDVSGANHGGSTAFSDSPITLKQMSVAISMSDTTLLVGETSTVTFTFSEAPLASSFVLADITAANGTMSNLVQTSDPKVWTALYTPTANVQSSTGNLITLAESSYTDLTGAAGKGASSAAFVVDTKPPAATTLTIGSITADNIVTSAESGAVQTITGTVGGGVGDDYVVGDVVTLKVNGNAYSGTVATGGTWSVTVPGADLYADADRTLSASILAHDTYGNAVTFNGTLKTYTSNAPVPTVSGVAGLTPAVVTASDEFPVSTTTLASSTQISSQMFDIVADPGLTLSLSTSAVTGKLPGYAGQVVVNSASAESLPGTFNTSNLKIKFTFKSGYTAVSPGTFNGLTHFDAVGNLIQFYDVNGVLLDSQTFGSGATTSSTWFLPTISKAPLVSYFTITPTTLEKWYFTGDTISMNGYTASANIADGSSTQQTPTRVSGTLNTALATGEMVEIFRNNVSIGMATVSGTTWTIDDKSLAAVATDVYTAKVKSTTLNTYLSASNVYTINPAPELVITDNVTTAVTVGNTAVTYTFNFSQPVTGFTAADITVLNGNIGAFTTISSSQYTLVVNIPATTTGDSAILVSVADGSYNALVSSAVGVAGTGAVAVQEYRTSGQSTTPTVKTLTGTTGIETLWGSDTGDNITGAGGADKIYAGAGDDTVVLNADNITQLDTASSGALVDAGAGTNILKLSGAGITLDLTAVTLSANLRNFSSVDLTGSGNNTVKLSLEDVLSMSGAVDNKTTGADESKMLVLNGDAGDVVQLVAGSQWTQTGAGLAGATLGGTVATNAYGASFGFVSGHTYARYAYGGATLFMDETVTLSMV